MKAVRYVFSYKLLLAGNSFRNFGNRSPNIRELFTNYRSHCGQIDVFRDVVHVVNVREDKINSAFSAGSSTHISLNDKDLLPLIDDNITEDIPFDPFQPRTYKASCNFEAGDEGHVYGDNIFTENTFTTSQLLSIELYDIVTSFNVPTECHRQLVNLMNTVFRDHDKLSKEYSPEILQAGPVNTLLKKKTAIKAHAYGICENVCKLYNNTQCEEECSHCGSKRFLEPTGDAPAPLVSVKTMKMMSLGDQLARLLGNEEYKALKDQHFFQSPDDIAVALLSDGFVNQKKSKQQLTIVHVMILNYDPSIRYTDEYLIQLAIIPGKPVDLDSFLLPIIDEVISLGKYGLIIKKFDGERIVGKVHMVMASGDIPQVTKYCHHKGHNSRYGCRVCEVLGEASLRGRGMYFKNCSAPLRPKIDFVNGNTNTNIQEPNIFARLPTFTGSSFYGLDEMHLIGHGIGKLVHKLIVLSNTTTSTNNYYPRTADGSLLLKDRYTFSLQKKDVLSAGQCIELSRSKIPVSFQGSWDNLMLKTEGTRAIDYIDLLLYVVPTLLVPLFTKVATQKALLALVRGCSISLQWNLNEELIVEMENHFSIWHQFLQAEITKNNISISVFSPVNHYLTHIGYMTRKVGNLRVYSTRSMERTIGRYLKLIKSRVFCGKNAGNLVERLAIRGYLNCAFNIEQQLDPIKSNQTSLDDYLELPLSSPHSQNHQLWSPFDQLGYLAQFVPIPTFIKELTTYYTRSKCTFPIDLHYTLETVKLVVRAWINNHVYGSEMYKQKRSEVRRGNHYVRINAIYQNHTLWYVGSVLFYFTHNPFDDESCRQFLVLVNVMKEHSVAEYDSNIPVVIMDTNSATQRLVVISLNDIQNQVGLVQSVECPMKYKVVAPYYIFNEDMKSTAGKLRYIKL
ncbi:hypothetical protein PHYBLDRAFT_148233 [Phycomyces blakesleeanus NRRL 1555(-)]|uniref:Uncharacterized protein n=1 Tax=Phycomyces blakesleeanus (strain ATCC 8743b / DSM 1359 / FGSC 10004 / NBRC 33097 / NRRL 1555) TaxID=763407 RepID=A0A167LSS3_PHYB8|nr:hypothetical protein PHYBLDRAFT_148233 [Phycomyces blakesleeanus NRRL 1555(-)]OAD71018.1 hypothetical protein PHYBLDRAFT_148233 [Phycomyces blakesleeanus NRRL 1555(-)]|eukprot:XP_018289058.1 hypothetical protein PHYBLDRAFT_148233 [Phycomyces blakesleeanus NRRL 1555(-)]